MSTSPILYGFFYAMPISTKYVLYTDAIEQDSCKSTQKELKRQGGSTAVINKFYHRKRCGRKGKTIGNKNKNEKQPPLHFGRPGLRILSMVVVYCCCCRCAQTIVQSFHTIFVRVSPFNRSHFDRHQKKG